MKFNDNFNSKWSKQKVFKCLSVWEAKRAIDISILFFYQGFIPSDKFLVSIEMLNIINSNNLSNVTNLISFENSSHFVSCHL
jgi:hypothetical protein